ncbi:MAG TPA: hypothetical protein VFN67_34030 [Polyangiales bacterium]|nr:hypothetical protein [Polyangiales bacterium]
MEVARGILLSLLAALGCGVDAPASVAERLPLTDTRRFVPVIAPLKEPQYPSLIDPDVRSTLLQKGYGEWDEAAGEPCVDHIGPDDGPEVHKRGPKARRLLRFAYLTDVGIVDDESPARSVNADQPSMFSSAFRPQESEICRMTNAMVRALNDVHAREPLKFVLLGGNLIDNAQSNELDWALQILGGASKVECDSADDTDLNRDVDDGKDPFAAPGLAMPFYWVTGNHDLLMQGALLATGPYAAFAVGEKPLPGFELRDFSQPGGLSSMGPTQADPRRAFLTRTHLMQRLAADGDGHGLSNEQVESGKAFYTFDIAGTPLRFVVLDTVADSGSADGLLRQPDVDAYVRPMLDRAKADAKWVVLVAHHRSTGLSDGAGFNGNVQLDALTTKQWRELLGEYSNILFSLAGHERADHLDYVQPENGHAFWELTSAALGDYPHQARVVELWDEDNGFVALETVYVDMDMRKDPVAEQGRHLGLMDFTSGWNPQFATGMTEQRNLRVFAKKP